MSATQLQQLVLGAQPWICGVATAGLVFWILLWLDRKRWWPSQWSLHLDTAATQTQPGAIGEICVVLPARNEAAMLPRTLPRLLKQADWYRRLVVVDDRSSDATAAIARRLEAGSPAEGKVRVVRIDDVPAGESGKVNAMIAGVAEATRDWDGDPQHQWFLFTDADVLHITSSIARLVSKANAENLDLVSAMVCLRASNFWEWLLIPPFLYFFHLLYPFRKASDPRSPVAAAAGGCILVRRSALEEADTLEMIRTRLIDDVALARTVKRHGGRCWLGLDPDLKSLRTYAGLGQISDMVARTAFEQLRHSYILLLLTWVGLLLMFIAPPILTLYGVLTLDALIAIPAVLAWMLQSASFLPVVQYLGVPSGFALTLPIAATLYGWMTARSAGHHLSGRHAVWRPSREDGRLDD